MKSSFLLMVYALCEAYGMTGDKECGEVANSCLEKIIASVSQEPIRKITCESGMETFFSSRLACMALCMGDFVGLHPENIGDCKNGLIKGLSKIFDCDPRGITLQEFLGALSCLSICNRIDSMWPPLSNSLNYYEPGNLPTDFNYNITEYCYYAGMKDDAKRSDELLWQNWNVKMKKFYADECIVLSDKIVDSKGKSHPQRYWNRNKASQEDYVLAETCMTALQLMVYYRYPASLSTDRE